MSESTNRDDNNELKLGSSNDSYLEKDVENNYSYIDTRSEVELAEEFFLQENLTDLEPKNLTDLSTSFKLIIWMTFMNAPTIQTSKIILRLATFYPKIM